MEYYINIFSDKLGKLDSELYEDYDRTLESITKSINHAGYLYLYTWHYVNGDIHKNNYAVEAAEWLAKEAGAN